MHIGYAAEAVLVGFALLDAQVRDFLASRLPHVSVDEGKEIVDAIESRRLSYYLGPLMKVATGHSALEADGMGEKLKRLTRCETPPHMTERNVHREMHRMRFKLSMSSFGFYRNGAGLDVPEALSFWSP